MEVDIGVGVAEEYLLHGVGDALGEGAIRCTGEDPVEVLPVLEDQAHGPVGEAGGVHQVDDGETAGEVLRTQFLRELQGGLDAHVLGGVDTGGEEHSGTGPRPVQEGHRQGRAPSPDGEEALLFGSWGGGPGKNFFHSVFLILFLHGEESLRQELAVGSGLLQGAEDAAPAGHHQPQITARGANFLKISILC